MFKKNPRKNKVNKQLDNIKRFIKARGQTFTSVAKHSCNMTQLGSLA